MECKRMGKIVRFMSERLEEVVSKMCGFRKPNSSIVESEKQRYQNLIRDYRVELQRCEECKDSEGVEYYSKLIQLLEDDLQRLLRWD